MWKASLGNAPGSVKYHREVLIRTRAQRRDALVLLRVGHHTQGVRSRSSVLGLGEVGHFTPPDGGGVEALLGCLGSPL